MSISSPALSSRVPDFQHYQSLKTLLTKRNGFFAFEGALRVFPADRDLRPNLEDWNAMSGWRSGFDTIPPSMQFFAEDVFGGQFAIDAQGIHSFDPETGDILFFAQDLEDWAAKLLKDFRVLTGYPLAHEWQTRHARRLGAEDRLLPYIPFIAGGRFDVENVTDCNGYQGMIWRSEVAKRIKSLPDGTKITLDHLIPPDYPRRR